MYVGSRSPQNRRVCAQVCQYRRFFRKAFVAGDNSGAPQFIRVTTYMKGVSLKAFGDIAQYHFQCALAAAAGMEPEHVTIVNVHSFDMKSRRLEPQPSNENALKEEERSNADNIQVTSIIQVSNTWANVLVGEFQTATFRQVFREELHREGLTIIALQLETSRLQSPTKDESSKQVGVISSTQVITMIAMGLACGLFVTAILDRRRFFRQKDLAVSSTSH